MKVNRINFFSLFVFTCLLAIQVNAQVKYYGGSQGKKFDHFLYYLNNFYIDSTDNEYLTDIAIRHALSVLDPFSTYQSAEELEQQQNRDNGYSPKGVGFGTYLLKGKHIINYVNPGGPADVLGIEKCDELLEINGIDLRVTSKDFVNQILVNTKDTFTISYKKHSGKTINGQLIKALIPLKSIESSYMIDQSTGYIKIGRFTIGTESEFVEAIAQLKTMGLSDLILDLRENPGGVKEQAVKLADHFISGNEVLTFAKGRHMPREEDVCVTIGQMEHGKLIVLCDSATASASELFLGAIQDLDRGLVVGNETFGKGLIQQSYKLGDGSAVRLTIAQYFTPTGRTIQKQEYSNWIQSVQKQLPPTGETAKGTFSGELFSRTKSGRKILTGYGGIIPDVYVAPSMDSELSNWNCYSQGYLYDFVINHTFVQRNILLKKFENSGQLKRDSVLEFQLTSELKNYLLEKNFTDIKMEAFEIPRAAIVKMKSWVCSILWNDAAYYELINEGDDLVKRASALMADEKRYEELLH